jgi:hypothetical protein
VGQKICFALVMAGKRMCSLTVQSTLSATWVKELATIASPEAFENIPDVRKSYCHLNLLRPRATR